MHNSPRLTIWTQSKTSLYIGISFVVLANLGSIGILAFAWEDLELYRIGLFVSIVASIFFLWLYAVKLDYRNGEIVLKFLFGQKQFKTEDIADARIYKRRGSEYLRLKFEKGYGPRKVFQFAIHQNGQEIADFLNELMEKGIKVYANRTLETKVYFSKERGQFECY
ncbi:MAG: hypothetical protein DCO96_01710 [Fluviicola sp. XM-24bin1]|nr:MAG: hypothetical protein DCO96_01710 [Fluviicola sp. XM-24bin1]